MKVHDIIEFMNDSEILMWCVSIYCAANQVSSQYAISELLSTKSLVIILIFHIPEQ